MSEKKMTVRKLQIEQENIDKMNEIKSSAGRTQQWIVNEALHYFFEHEWDRLIK